MSSVNNKRIAKNTFYLYLRMLLVMAISLYTVRAILDILGVVDYGIYNVVGGVVTMFAFMNRTLSTSSQRYFSIELARGDIERLSKWFCLNIIAFLSIGLIITFFLETVGLWFVNNKMTIPEERMTAANVVYQLSIISFLFHIVSIPYLALIIAHEKMNVFAYVGVIEAIGRLGIVFVLMSISYDHLIVYGICILLLSLGVAMSYIIYCWMHYPESKFHWYWNTAEVKELLGFSGWHFMGTFSSSCRSQGINILLNLFFNPAVNAARAVAYQIYGAVELLVNNFFTAVKPQIYKSYASHYFEDLFKLINRSTLICTFLISLIYFPLLLNTEFVLGLWLKTVPQYAIVFTRLVLLNALIDALNQPMTCAALATGKIKKYELWLSSITLMNIPVTYIALRLGAAPYAAMIVSNGLSCICVVVRAKLLKGMINFPLKPYFYLVFKVSAVTILMISVVLLGLKGKVYNFQLLIVYAVLVDLLLVSLYLIIITRSDRRYIINFFKSKIKINN